MVVGMRLMAWNQTEIGGKPGVNLGEVVIGPAGSRVMG